MANVPREYGATVQAQPLQPQYQSARGADQTAFGTALDTRGFQQTAQAVEQIGNSLMQAQRKIQERNDVVARAREFGAFGEFATTTLTALQDTGDIADPRTVQTYRQNLDDKIAEMVGNHAGSEDSRAVLQSRLYEQRSSLLDQAAVTSAAAGRKAVTDQLGTELSKEAAVVGADPTQFTAAMARWNSKLDDFANALTPDEERMFRKQGPAAFVGASIDNILSQPNGDIEAMKLLQNSPGLMSFLSPPEQNALQQRIRVVASANAEQRNKVITLGPNQVAYRADGSVVAKGPYEAPPQTEGQKAMEMLSLYAKLTNKTPTDAQIAQKFGMGTPGKDLAAEAQAFETEFTARLKHPPSPQQWEKFFGVAEGDKTKSLADRIPEVRALTGADGKPLNDEQWKSIAAVHKDTSMSISQKLAHAENVLQRPLADNDMVTLGSFYNTPEEAIPGPDLENDALTVFSNLAERYAAGDTTPLEDRQIEGAVINYIQATTFTNPDTGLTETRRNTLPDYVKKAVKARGRVALPDDVETDAPAGAGGKPGAEGAQQQPEGTQQPGSQQPQGTQGADAGPPTKQNAAAQREPTIYELATDVAGIGATAKGIVGRAPVVGGGFPKEVTSQSRVETAQSAIISALRNVDTRFLGQNERTQLEQRLDIAGGLEDPAAYQQRLIGIDIDLETRLDNALETAANKKTTKEARQAALDAINTIRQVRKQLLPDRFDVVDDDFKAWYESAPEGTPYLAKKGDSYEARVKTAKKPAKSGAQQ
jgi:hypothetical protein